MKLLGRLLPHHLVRIFIFPDPKKDRLAKTVITCPLRKLYLADHCRFNPTATLHFGSSQPLVPTVPASCRDVEKGTGIDPDLLQFRIETAQKLIAKAGPDSAAEFEVLAFVKADQKRAAIFP